MLFYGLKMLHSTQATQTSSKNIHQWLDEYAASHQNPINKAIHWVCVPVIFFTVMALLWSIPTPAFFESVPFLNFGSSAMLLALILYARLSLTMAVGMLIYCLIIGVLIQWWIQLALLPLWLFATILFVLAWIGQFIGHHIEGKKPSFFNDLQFLLIGPAWVMAFLLRKWKISF